MNKIMINFCQPDPSKVELGKVIYRCIHVPVDARDGGKICSITLTLSLSLSLSLSHALTSSSHMECSG
jgi:hypothetical protein